MGSVAKSYRKGDLGNRKFSVFKHFCSPFEPIILQVSAWRKTFVLYKQAIKIGSVETHVKGNVVNADAVRKMILDI